MLRLLPLLALAACAPDLPGLDGTVSAAARSQPYPRLLPLDPLLAEGGRASAAQAAQVELAARSASLSQTTILPPEGAQLAAEGQALRDRAAAARAPATSPPPNAGDLAARGEALRNRAAALRDAPL